MPECAIIFGITGQDGHYLRLLLIAAGCNVIGVSRRGGPWLKGDVGDLTFVNTLIAKHQPAYIFHLAANSTTSHHPIFENHKTISDGCLNILECVYQHSKHTRVFLSGSGLQFKNTGHPIKETDELVGTSIYSVERIYTVYAARYFRDKGLKIYIGYFFHHDSPFRNERHLNMMIVKTAMKIKEGLQSCLEIGNPDVVKEFNHASDMMNAVWLLVQQEVIFEAVIGSGIGHSIMDWIDICFGILGISKEGRITVNREYSADFLKLIAHPATMISLGWRPKFNINSLAMDMINNG